MMVKCNWCDSTFNEKYITNRKNSETCPCCEKVGYLIGIEETDNYIKYSQEVINRLPVTELVWFSQGADNLSEIIHSIVKELRTEKRCPRCGETLYCSDLPEYEYVCVECDENFYEFEVM